LTRRRLLEKQAVISIRGLSFSFDGPPVLENVDLDIKEGDFALMVGPNGGGKTTLLKIILGLLEAQSGSVELFGASPKDARHRIGYMPQHLHSDPLFPVTVEEIVLMGRLGYGAPIGPFRSGDYKAVDDVLDVTGTKHLKSHPFPSLSGGQRQLVLIARALASKPDLLLLDEPTANLDPAVQDTFNDLLHRLNREMTVIMVSHDVGFVSSHATKVVCVNRTVALHPTSDASGDLVSMIYGETGMRIVHHESEA
jgi:zinc transport system ATP-binding protein